MGWRFYYFFFCCIELVKRFLTDRHIRYRSVLSLHLLLLQSSLLLGLHTLLLLLQLGLDVIRQLLVVALDLMGEDGRSSEEDAVQSNC